MPPPPLVPRDSWNLGAVLFGPEAIRSANPQRFEMEQLDAICHLDAAEVACVGWKDVGDDEFWVRGHIPGRPLMPGVVQLEALAQLVSFLTAQTTKIDGFFGFGGIDAVKFRAPVVPGDRLVLVGRRVELRRRRAVYDTQGWVGERLAVEGRITGMLM